MISLALAASLSIFIGGCGSGGLFASGPSAEAVATAKAQLVELRQVAAESRAAAASMQAAGQLSAEDSAKAVEAVAKMEEYVGKAQSVLDAVTANPDVPVDVGAGISALGTAVGGDVGSILGLAGLAFGAFQRIRRRADANSVVAGIDRLSNRVDAPVNAAINEKWSIADEAFTPFMREAFNTKSVT